MQVYVIIVDYRKGEHSMTGLLYFYHQESPLNNIVFKILTFQMMQSKSILTSTLGLIFLFSNRACSRQSKIAKSLCMQLDVTFHIATIV